MMQKPRGPLGRTRATPRIARRTAGASEPDAHLVAAQRVAARFVAARWPELAAVKPMVTRHFAHQPDHALRARLDMPAAERGLPVADEAYVFTFNGERSMPNSLTAPLVAVVVVDAHQRIIKTSASK